MKQYQKMYPQLVELINKDNEPIEVVMPNLPLSGDGSTIRVQLLNSSFLGLNAVSATSFIVTFDNILILNSDGGFASLPMNTTLYNVTQSQINTSLANIKSAYANLVANSASATLHYCQFNNTKVLQSFSYSLKD